MLIPFQHEKLHFSIFNKKNKHVKNLCKFIFYLQKTQVSVEYTPGFEKKAWNWAFVKNKTKQNNNNKKKIKKSHASIPRCGPILGFSSVSENIHHSYLVCFFLFFLKRSHPGGSSNEIKPIKLICAPVNSREKSSEKCFLPFGMSEADVVLLSPACKHLFLCNKAMVVSSSAALVLDVCYTFITAPGLVVVVWHLLGSRFSSGKTNWFLYWLTGLNSL